MRAIGTLCAAALSSIVAPAVGAQTPPTVVGTSEYRTSVPIVVPVVSGDGRFVAFASERDTLVPDDTNGSSDVFVFDRRTNATSRASVSSGGAEGHGVSYAPALSFDGRFVAFTSVAPDLIANDTNGMFDVFVRDRQAATTTRVSVASDGTEGNGHSAFPAISGDGRYVAFLSDASNFVPDDTNQWFDVFVHDRATGTTTRVSTGQQGSQARWGALFAPTISADGCLVAFYSPSDDLVPGDGNGAGDVFVYDCRTGTTTRSSVSSGQAEADSGSFEPAISANGRYVAFHSDATTLVAGDTNGRFDVFVHDLLSGETTRESVATGGGEASDGDSAMAAISGDGGRVVYSSTAALAADDHDTDTDVFLRDRRTGVTTLLTTDASGEPADHRYAAMSSDGHFVAYSTAMLDLGTTGTEGGESLLFTSTAPTYQSFLAEGANTDFFRTRLALLNPTDWPASATLRFQRAVGGELSWPVSVPAHTRVTVEADDVPGVADAEFSTELDTDEPLVMDRTMTWDRSGYGAHAETALPSAATRWYLAEGATHSGLELFYLIQNANDVDADVEVRYLLPAPAAPIVQTYRVPAASRFNVWVDREPGLGNTDVSAVITSPVPVIVERAMYLSSPQEFFGAGHESAGITAPATRWFLAEGATGPFFDLFVLVANPGDTGAEVTATFLLPNGDSVEKHYPVAPSSRFNIWVDLEDPRLADTAVSTTVESTNGVPIIVERAMWWPGYEVAPAWYEAHNSAGTTATGTAWALAEGEVGGDHAVETYILVANTSASDTTVQVTLFFEDGTTAARSFPVRGRSRFNVAVAVEFPESHDRRFGAVVESTGAAPAQLVVERAVYWDRGGQFWAAGTDALATRLR